MIEPIHVDLYGAHYYPPGYVGVRDSNGATLAPDGSWTLRPDAPLFWVPVACTRRHLDSPVGSCGRLKVRDGALWVDVAFTVPPAPATAQAMIERRLRPAFDFGEDAVYDDAVDADYRVTSTWTAGTIVCVYLSESPSFGENAWFEPLSPVTESVERLAADPDLLGRVGRAIEGWSVPPIGLPPTSTEPATPEMLAAYRAASVDEPWPADGGQYPPGDVGASGLSVAAALKAGDAPVVEGVGRRQVAGLIVRQAMALTDEGIGPYDPRPVDQQVLDWAVKQTADEYDDHQLWDAGLVSDEVHVPRCQRGYPHRVEAGPDPDGVEADDGWDAKASQARGEAFGDDSGDGR